MERSVILTHRLGPDILLVSSGARAFKNAWLIICFECVSNQKVAYVFVAFK